MSKKSKTENYQYTIISKQSVRLFAEVVGFDDLSNDVIELLCEEVNYRIREVTQLSLDFMKQTKRKRLLVSDVNMALENLDVQPVFGYGVGSKEIKYIPCQEDESLFYPEENVVDLFGESSVEIPVMFVQQPEIKRSWLAINGLPVQDMADGVSISWPSLSEDENVYLDLVTTKLFETDEDQQKEILKNVHKSSFLNRLLPHILDFLTKKVEHVGSSHVSHLLLVMDYLRMLLTNQCVNFQISPFLESVANIIRQCQVGIYKDDTDIWDLQESASHIVPLLIRLSNPQINNIQQNHEEFLLGLLSSSSQALYVYYGAVTGLLALGIESLEKGLALISGVLQQTMPDTSSSSPRDMQRMLEISKLTMEKILKHHLSQKASAGDKVAHCLNSSVMNAYLNLQELFGDSLSIRLPCINFFTKNENAEREQVLLELPGKDLFSAVGDDGALLGLVEDEKVKEKDDIRIKATLSDPLHGIKLKISKCFDQSKEIAPESNLSGTCHDFKSKKLLNKAKTVLSTNEMFEEVSLKNRDDLVISFRFRNQSSLNTFTEKRKAQILARDLTRQHAATSRYRELCNSLRPYSRSALLFKRLHVKNFKSPSASIDIACVI